MVSAAQETPTGKTSEVDFADYTSHNWYSLNDDVMGGKSKGHYALDKETSDFSFWGELSFENRGGFASIRTDFEEGVLQGAEGLKVELTGDGRTYQMTTHKEK